MIKLILKGRKRLRMLANEITIFPNDILITQMDDFRLTLEIMIVKDGTERYDL